MAIDTLAKRNSTLIIQGGAGLVVPDGTIDQGDRQSILNQFSGILAGAAVEVAQAIQTVSIRMGISL